jgi:hypothetical protein
MITALNIVLHYISVLLILEYIQVITQENNEEEHTWLLKDTYEEEGMFYALLYVVFSPSLLLYVTIKKLVKEK